MSVKHKVLKDFQLLTGDKKIIILKAKTVLEDYKYVTKNDNVLVERDIIDNNPDFFAAIDWKEELNTFLRQNKIPQPAIITKKLVPFIEEMFIINNTTDAKIDPVNSTNLYQKELELESKLKRLELREKQMIQEQEELAKRETESLKKQKELIEQEAKLNSRLLELNTKEAAILEKESQLVAQENDLKTKDSYLTNKEQNMDKFALKSEIKESLLKSADVLVNTGYLHGNRAGVMYTIQEFINQNL